MFSGTEARGRLLAARGACSHQAGSSAGGSAFVSTAAPSSSSERPIKSSTRVAARSGSERLGAARSTLPSGQRSWERAGMRREPPNVDARGGSVRGGGRGTERFPAPLRSSAWKRHGLRTGARGTEQHRAASSGRSLITSRTISGNNSNIMKTNVAHLRGAPVP